MIAMTRGVKCGQAGSCGGTLKGIGPRMEQAAPGGSDPLAAYCALASVAAYLSEADADRKTQALFKALRPCVLY